MLQLSNLLGCQDVNNGNSSTVPDSHATTDSSGSIGNGDSNPTFSTTTNDGSISLSHLASAIKNEVHSIIRNTIGGIIHKTPFLLPFH